MNINQNFVADFLDGVWQRSVVPTLSDYIRIPNKSPAFAPDWAALGHMDAAVELLANWARAQPIAGMRVEVQRLEGRTPLLFIEVPGAAGTVLLYGHLDKQPEFSGWQHGLDPWQPVIRDGRLYGRGGADDGYALFSCLTAIAALQAQHLPHARCVVLIEACEESGSVDLPFYLDALAQRIGEPSLVVCLDAECGNYEQLWSTTSLRGVLSATLRVRLLREGVHSGMGTGIAATPFRIAQQLLSRIESPVDGEILLPALQAPVPADRRAQIEVAARVLGPEIAGKLPFVQGARPLCDDPVQLLVNNTWRSTLAVTGADGLPATAHAGNVLLPEVALRLSIRLAPTTDPETALAAVREALLREVPYGAHAELVHADAAPGWNAPRLASWLERLTDEASRSWFGREPVYAGGGGSIPFMGMLGRRFPRTQFLITGVLGPASNAHGPNEFLHLDYAQRLTGCVAQVLAGHATAQT